MKRPIVRLKFEPRDLWVGIFWDHCYDRHSIKVYVCLVPLLPIIFEWPL